MSAAVWWTESFILICHHVAIKMGHPRPLFRIFRFFKFYQKKLREPLSSGYRRIIMSGGHGFQSRHRILDGIFFTLICWKFCNDICLKRPKTNYKRGQGRPIIFKNCRIHQNSNSDCRITLHTWPSRPNFLNVLCSTMEHLSRRRKGTLAAYLVSCLVHSNKSFLLLCQH